jgi:ABC-type dipeptide/oligopeptide/nickel transport system permease subunit
MLIDFTHIKGSKTTGRDVFCEVLVGLQFHSII